MNFSLILCFLMISVANGAENDELVREEETRRQKIEALNAKNPFSADYGNKTVITDETIDQAQKLLDRPGIQHMLRAAADPFFLRTLNDFASHPKKKDLLKWELGWLLFYFFFRAWRMGRIQKWYSRAFFSLVSFGIFWVMAAVVIPWGVLWDFDWSWIRSWGDFVGRVFRG